MIGTLGTALVFEVSDEKIFTPSSMTREVTGKWTTHARMGQKDQTEFTGAGLQAMTITITISAQLGVAPRTTLETIETMVEDGQAEYLTIGTSVVGTNPFKITASSETWDKLYNEGELAKATLSLTLEEYT